MSVNRIGPFAFVALTQPPHFVQQQLAIRARPGVDGVMLQRMGVRADPFQIESMVDTLSLMESVVIYHQYTQLVGAGAVTVIWANQALLAANHAYHVLAVEPVELRAILRGHGGLNGASWGRCKCLWTLQPILLTV